MKTRFLLSGFVLLFALPATAQTPAGPQSFDQYPSFVEASVTGPDGTQSVLRCGYMVTPQGLFLDPGYREISIFNPGRGSYSRVQRIDDLIIATANDPRGTPDFLLELVKPDGSVTAKACTTDPNSDTISNCAHLVPFTFANQLGAADTETGQRCDQLMREGSRQIDPSLADPQKTQTFKNALRQKAAILAAP